MFKITLIKSAGDIFETQADAIVNAVNCRGIMGSGIAKAFADRYPKMLEEYKKVCRRGQLDIGQCHCYFLREPVAFDELNIPTEFLPENWNYILNCPTMYNPGSIADKADIVISLFALFQMAIKKDIHTIAMPYLGCGVGHLPKPEFERILNMVIDNFNSDIANVNSEPISVLLVDYKKS